MSYSGLSGYGSYYSHDNDQSAQGQYNTLRRANNAAALPDPTRQTQYGQNGYTWSTQTQNDYPTSNNNQSYSDNSWRTNSDGTSYNYPRPPTHNTSTSNASSISYYSSTSQSQASVSTPALHSLAYASGLEAAGMQGSRTSQTNTPASTSFPNTQGVERVRSPAQTQHHNYSRSINVTSNDYRPRSSQSQRNAAQAAAALTATANRIQQQQKQQQQQQPAQKPQPQQSSSAQPSYQQNTNYGQNQNYASGTTSSPSSNTKPKSSTRETAGVSSSSYATQTAQALQTHQPSAQASSSGSYGKVIPSDIQRRANAAIFDGTSRSQATNSTGQTTNTGSMPSFIDPSEVFNPYHYELERRKREEATKTYTQPHQPSPEAEQLEGTVAEVQKTTAEEVPGSEPKVKKPRKPREKKARKFEPAASTQEPSIAQQSLTPQPTKASSSGSEENMANEMKSMIEKMREWKSKDPRLFQALWEDMKKGSAPGPASTPSQPFAKAASPAQETLMCPKAANKATKQAQKDAIAAEKPREGTSVQYPGQPIKFSATPAANAANQPQILGLDGTVSPTQNSKASPSPKQPAANISAKIQWKDSSTAQASLPQSGAGLAQPPASISHAFPQPQANGGTIWPEAKRKALADAASQALSSDPANAGKTIAPDVIQGILAENPTYIELCQKIEHRGFCLNRQKFARFLLGSVPDLSQQQRAGRATHSPAPPQTGAKVEVKQLRQSSVASTNSPVPLTPTQGARAPSQHVKSAVPQRTVKKSSLPEPAPGSKAAMARKRDFSEIVDLSQLSDYEDDDPVLKQPRIATPPPQIEPLPTPGLDPNTSTLLHPDVSQAYPGSYVAYGTGRPGAFASNPPVAKSFGEPPTSYVRGAPRKQPAVASVVKPLDKEKAFKKSFYNPKTVARDILIAAGRHPTERPLNFHLAQIMSRVPSLSFTNQADLSTFDWDSIDPGGPPMPQVEEVDVEDKPPRFTLGSRVPVNSAKHGLPQATPRGAVASTSKTAVNPHPTLAQQLSLANSQASNGLPGAAKPRQSALPSRLSDVIVNDRKKSSAKPALSTPQVDHSRPAASPHSSMTSGAEGVKRRGRPPGTKNSVKNPQSSITAAPSRTPELGDLAPPLYTSFNCEWRNCGRQLHNLRKLQKHINKSHAQQDGTAHYTCWWRRCPLLKKVDGEWQPSQKFTSQGEWLQHVIKAHLDPLAWDLGDGPSDVPTGKTKQKSTPNLSQYAFKPDLSFTRPAPYPASTASSKTQRNSVDPQTLEKNRKTYTSDLVTGRQVTPLASSRASADQPLDPMTLPIEDPKLQSSYFKTHSSRGKSGGKHAAAEELLRAIQWRKEQVGAGIDRGGATLVTEAMRKTLLDDEGIARAVSDDEDSDDGEILHLRIKR